jgi:hypothetical protein
MSGGAEISKKQRRGKPFPKGVSGNPGGRPKRTEEEVSLAEACRAKTSEALVVVETLMRESSNDRVRLAAAEFVIERGWGKAMERVELAGRPVQLTGEWIIHGVEPRRPGPDDDHQ